MIKGIQGQLFDLDKKFKDSIRERGPSIGKVAQANGPKFTRCPDVAIESFDDFERLKVKKIVS